jgi:hypothetical protein
VRGRVETGRLIVVEGAVYEGQLRMDAPAEAISDAMGSEPDDQAHQPAPAQPATGSYSFLRSFAPGDGQPAPAADALPAQAEDDEPE